MPQAFWDASALTPLFVEQASTSMARRLSFEFEIAVWWGTHTEIHSAMARMRRSGEMDQSTLDHAIGKLRVAHRTWDRIRPMNSVQTEAQRILYRYPLRAADSLQLAAASVWAQGRPSGKTFIGSDLRLCAAAENEGFAVVQP